MVAPVLRALCSDLQVDELRRQQLQLRPGVQAQPAQECVVRRDRRTKAHR
jgi:hypothetical protein